MEAQTKEAEQALLNLSSAFVRNTRKAMEDSTQLIQDQARAKHKFRSISGAAEGAIEADVKQSGDSTVGTVEINPTVKHAIYQHEGTGLYGPKHKAFDIFPKNKKMLRFATSSGTAKYRPSPYGRFQDGGFTLAYGVTNPGVKADPFVYDALNDKESEMEKIFQDYSNRTVKEAGLE